MGKRRLRLLRNRGVLLTSSAGWKLPLALALIVGVTLALIGIAFGGSLSIGFRPETSSHGRVDADTPAQRFAFLRDQQSNRCGLQADSFAMLPASGRLQGACCASMNLTHYEQQLSGLKSSRAVPLVPVDPYDVSVRLAARLVAYDRSIKLDRRERRVYDQAMRISREHGPCCCRCWRWSAFAGQAKRLITHSDYRAREVARVWDLEDGCGGPAD